MALLIKGGRLICPKNKIDGIFDILIEKQKIISIQKEIKTEGVRSIDARGKIVSPGLVDIHTHLRIPGREDEETLYTGSLAAGKGGFTTVLCMPNTSPPIDNRMTVSGILDEARKIDLVNILVCGTITKRREGKEISDFGELKEAGCVAVSDDGEPVKDSSVMRRAIEYAKMPSLLVISHCEDKDLSSYGCIHEDKISTILGLRPIPEIAETIFVAREIELSRYLNSHIHLSHISLARSIELIRRAKEEKISISCDTCPHYFTLTNESTKTYDTNTKVNPPLRTEKDKEAIKRALKEGIIDCISTDHAPHTQAEKELEFEKAPFGVIGLETALSLGITELVEKGILGLSQLIEKMSLNPARLLGLKNKGSLSEGSDADIVIFDPNKEWIVKKEEILSKSKNSPFIGWKLRGVVEHTICRGKIVYKG